MTQVRSSVAYSLNARMSFKLIVVGDAAVGKTSLVLRYVKGTFSKNYSVSLGVEFYSKLVAAEEDEIALQIWDTVPLPGVRPARKTSSPS